MTNSDLQAGSKSYDIVLFSTADWDYPIWTNKQHVAQELARLGHRVLYIDSLGLRKPSTNKRDLRRIKSRLTKSINAPRQVKKNLWVWSPLIIPLNHLKLFRYLNHILLNFGLMVWCNLLRLRRFILWTYNPLTLEFFDAKKFSYIIYHCVDEIKEQPGMPVKLLEESEEKLCRNADLIFTTSLALQETRQAWNANTFYFPNVADFSHFSSALEEDTLIPEDIAKIPKPRIGFVGAINSYKLNLNLLKEIAMQRPQWSIVLIGQVGEGEPWASDYGLEDIQNIYVLGSKPYVSLPGYLKGIDVAILPNQVNAYTNAMFPMKFFEYLAAGKPIVSVDLRSIYEFSDYVDLVKTKDDFLNAIEKNLLGLRKVPVYRQMNLAKQYTYHNRTQSMIKVFQSVCLEDLAQL